jgi:ankyrin repeat protein
MVIVHGLNDVNGLNVNDVFGLGDVYNGLYTKLNGQRAEIMGPKNTEGRCTGRWPIRLVGTEAIGSPLTIEAATFSITIEAANLELVDWSGTSGSAGNLCLAVDKRGRNCLHWAAYWSQPAALRLLGELFERNAGVLGATPEHGWTVAHWAARADHHPAYIRTGDEACLTVLYDLGLSLTAEDDAGRTPAHVAALYGRWKHITTLHALGAGATLSAADAKGDTPAHLTAYCPLLEGPDSVLCDDGASAKCLRAICTHGASATLSQKNNDNGDCPAHCLTRAEKPESLAAVATLGHASSFSVLNRRGENCTLLASSLSAPECLTVFADNGAAEDFMIHRLGPMKDTYMEEHRLSAPSEAAFNGDVKSLKILHAGVCTVVDPILGALSNRLTDRASAAKLVDELEAERRFDLSESVRVAHWWTPAYFAACRADRFGCAQGFEDSDVVPYKDGDEDADGNDWHARKKKRVRYLECLLFLREIGGMAGLWAQIARSPTELLGEGPGYHCRCLLTDPRLLNLAAKQAWLQSQLAELVDDADAVALQLVASRERCAPLLCCCPSGWFLLTCALGDCSILDGLCGAFGVHEHNGSLEGPNTLPRSIDVRFRASDGDESGSGDGLRREFFAKVRFKNRNNFIFV